jgi:hypothetical protein
LGSARWRSAGTCSAGPPTSPPRSACWTPSWWSTPGRSIRVPYRTPNTQTETAEQAAEFRSANTRSRSGTRRPTAGPSRYPRGLPSANCSSHPHLGPRETVMLSSVKPGRGRPADPGGRARPGRLGRGHVGNGLGGGAVVEGVGGRPPARTGAGRGRWLPLNLVNCDATGFRIVFVVRVHKSARLRCPRVIRTSKPCQAGCQKNLGSVPGSSSLRLLGNEPGR